MENRTDNTATMNSIDKNHSHHWRIAEPDGEYSDAVCVGCGAEKRFRNWLAETDYITRSEVGLAA